MKCEKEGPTGHLSVLCLLVFYPGTLGNTPCDWNVFPGERSITARPEEEDEDILSRMDQTIDLNHRVTERGAGELPCSRKMLAVAPTHIFEDTRSWVRDRKTTKGADKTHSGRCREVPRPVCDHNIIAAGINATDEDVKTIRDNDGVELGQCRHGREVFQG